MIVHSKYGITLLTKKFIYIKKINKSYLNIIKISRNFIKIRKTNIKYKIIKNVTLNDTQWALKILIPKLKLHIINWRKFSGFGWSCNYDDNNTKKIIFSNIKIKITKHKIEFNYDVKDLELLIFYIMGFIENIDDSKLYINNHINKWDVLQSAIVLYNNDNCYILSNKNLLSYYLSFSYNEYEYFKDAD